jgi:hypothetical protein
VFQREGIQVVMMSQGASKTNIRCAGPLAVLPRPRACHGRGTWAPRARQPAARSNLARRARLSARSLVVDGAHGTQAVLALHREFFQGPSVCGSPVAGVTVSLPNGNGAAQHN